MRSDLLDFINNYNKDTVGTPTVNFPTPLLILRYEAIKKKHCYKLIILRAVSSEKSGPSIPEYIIVSNTDSHWQHFVGIYFILILSQRNNGPHFFPLKWQE